MIIMIVMGAIMGLLLGIQYVAILQNISVFSTKKDFKKELIPFHIYYTIIKDLIEEYRSLK